MFTEEAHGQVHPHVSLVVGWVTGLWVLAPCLGGGANPKRKLPNRRSLQKGWWQQRVQRPVGVQWEAALHCNRRELASRVVGACSLREMVPDAVQGAPARRES